MLILLFFTFYLSACTTLSEERHFKTEEYFSDPQFYTTMEDMGQVCPNQRLCAQLHEALSGIDGNSDSTPTDWYTSLTESQNTDSDFIDDLKCCSPCSCDSDCMLWKKCCPDAEEKYLLIDNMTEIQRSVSCILPYTLPHHDVLDDLTETILPSIRYNVLNSCPPNTDPDLASRCEDDMPLDLTFDSVVFRSGKEPYMVYRNKYCAQCNDVLVNTTRSV